MGSSTTSSIWNWLHVPLYRRRQSIDTELHAIEVYGVRDRFPGFDALLPLLRDSSLQARTRARVTEGLGASLSRSGNIELSDLYQFANFLVFPGWLQAIGTVRR